MTDVTRGPSHEIVTVPAAPGDVDAVRYLLEGALLEPGPVERRVDAGRVLIAVRPDATSGSADRRPLGVLVFDLAASRAGAHVESIVVRPRRRDEGIGTRLIVDAFDRFGRLTAEFDERVRPFYDALDFDITPTDGSNDRLRGVLDDRPSESDSRGSPF